jgi:hypothetical protein
MVGILRKMFEVNPEKSTIVLKDKCSDCGCEVIIDIRSVSGGYGLLGGALFKSSRGGYSAKCPYCYKITPKKID